MKVLSPVNKAFLEGVMRDLTFVKWDRYAGDDEYVDIYGWIDRDEDAYKDFILLSFDKTGLLRFTTSSAAYSDAIHRIITGVKEGHNACQRVEGFFNVPNAIKL